ncbi:hypothetical protein B0J13DRAFT_474060 [Dactylonectria estremocensis]|uniref:CENP-V/GFA domain-containing protein n=1 Tax=Dactylonectria estremocensis TaxID=1079267 RepID=A0A9P9EUG7_9HYPO|nr:hypothetical protein B0J13DRAFT_474060 [Dactylonectria estremocensis]
MGLPDEENIVTGGCSCGAIRYRLAVPAIQDRPPHPFSPPSSGVRLPQALTCHCNDCRRITGSFLAVGVIDIPAPMLTVSAISPASESTIVSGRILDVLADGYDAEHADASRPPYFLATDVFRATQESKTWLRFFHSVKSGPEMSRSFCGRCGTPLCFHFHLLPEFCHDGKMPENFADFFHVNLGTVDRKFLDLDWFVPTVEVFFKNGTPFSKMVSATAKGLKDVTKMQEFDGVVGEEELEELGT